MYIKVNKETQQFPDTTTLQMLVEKLKISTNGIAIAINDSVVKRVDWSSRLLHDQDDILIIKSTQGG